MTCSANPSILSLSLSLQDRGTMEEIDQMTIPRKSILKKSQADHSSCSRSRSPSPLRERRKPPALASTDSNEVLHLAEMTAKENSPKPTHCLFEQTMSVFETTDYTCPLSSFRRPSRLRYYIKPYRGEANLPANAKNQRGRSLSEQRLAQKARAALSQIGTRRAVRPSS